MLALPFGRIVFCVGKPMMVDRNADDAAEEKARLMVEQEMNRMVDMADGITHA